MNIFWINTGNNKADSSVAETLNRNSDYAICDFSIGNKSNDISYFTFCHQKLMRHLLVNDGSTEKDLILLNLDLQTLYIHRYELLYILSLIYPLDPIMIGTFPGFLKELFGIKFDNVISFSSDHEFVIDLEKKMDAAKISHDSEVSKVISIFKAHGMLLSVGNGLGKIIRLKGNNGVVISYDEFIEILNDEISKDNSFLRNISKYSFLREHTPVDLFIQKYLKK